MRKQFATSIDTEISEKFKQSCEDYGLKMNVVLEALMTDFADGDYKIIVTKSGITVERG